VGVYEPEAPAVFRRSSFIDLNEGQYNKNRFYSGVSCKLTEHLGGAVFYLWESPKRGGGWDNLHILGTSLVYSF